MPPRTRRATLLADIGGTNARVALLSDGVLAATMTYAVAQHGSFDEVIAQVRRGFDGKIADAYLAVAGPVADGHARLTNSGWILDTDALRSAHGFEHVRVVNDFEAAANGLPLLGPADLCAIGGGQVAVRAPQVMLGPGTGFGLACRVPSAHGDIILPTEAGHATLPCSTAREDAIARVLREKFGHVSIERAVSGSGLENLYEAITICDGIDAPARSAADITAAALEGLCAISVAAVDLFLGYLGGVAGNAALTFGARGGVYIAGGIAPRLVSRIAGSDLRERFDAKGRFGAYLQAIPLNIITGPNTAVLGLSRMAQAAAEGAPGKPSLPE